MTEIISTDDLAMDEFDGYQEPRDPESSLVATDEAEGRGIEFHVSMRNYTQRDMEGLVVEAAARLIVGRKNEADIAKAIEAKCIELVDARATKALTTVTAEIIDQPMTPSFGDKKPVTMREFLGLYGREYLTERVGQDGKPYTGAYSSRSLSRMEWLVGQYMNAAFDAEIKKATSAAIVEIQGAIRARHKELLDAETARVREALNKATGASQ